MKRISFVFGAAMAAIFALTSCNKEISNPDEIIKDGIPFEISAASADTKTSNSGLSTNWVAGDKLNLFHAEAGSTEGYINDGSFSIAEEDLASKKFKGKLGSPLEEGNYDWYALYPYNQNVSTPANTGTKGYVTVGGKSQTQEGNSSTAHLCRYVCPLYGVSKSVASSATPGITMNHLTSIIEVNVTNNSGSDLTVSNVSFTATEDIVGTYYIDFTGQTVAYTGSGASYVSETASLTVNNGTAIADKGSATFYIAIKPFTVSSGVLKVAVNGYEKEININEEVTFTAGLIKTINFNYDFALSNSLTDGSYIIAVKDGDKYYAMKSSQNGTSDRRDYLEIDYSGSGSYETTNSSIVWSIENTQAGITISNNGQYIIAAKNTAKLGQKSSASVISFASQSDGSYWFSYDLGQTDGTRYLAKNGNNGFGFYASSTGIKNILLIPADFNAIPSIVLEQSSISVASTGGPATISYQILNPIEGKTITAVSNSSWVNNIITSVKGEISFSVDENSEAAREAILTISYEGATNVTVTVQQKAAGAAASKQYTLTITKADFNSSSYADNNNDKTTKAVAKDGTTMDVTWYSNQVMLSSSTMQWQKNAGYIYNKTDLGEIVSVTVNSTDGTYTTYYGATQNPTSSTTVSGGYFTVKVGGATGKTTSVVVVFNK